MNKIVSVIKLIKDVITGKECYFSIQQKKEVKWFGNTFCGFYVCSELLSEQSIVYSFGVGEDISFDEELMKKGCMVYAYDPTPKSQVFIEKKNPSFLFSFKPYGIADYDGNAKFYLPENDEFVSCTTYNRWGYDESRKKPLMVEVKRLSTLMKENGHSHIDLLKIDIEGSEYDVIDNILEEELDIDQICVEVHHRFPGIGVRKTKDMVKKLNENGYFIVAISNTREEYTFLRF